MIRYEIIKHRPKKMPDVSGGSRKTRVTHSRCSRPLADFNYSLIPYQNRCEIDVLIFAHIIIGMN